MRKIIRMIGISIAVIFGLIVIIGTLSLNCSPQFGKGITKDQKREYSKLGNFQNGKFINQHPSPMDVNYWKIFKELTKNAANRNPTKNILIEKIDSTTIKNHDANITQLTWFGHSTFLLETELNWWESVEFDSINLVCTPARHFSGRGLFDRATTLWCSWVIKGTKDNIYFSGDSGYDIHFKEIGDKYGPFDISMMECGQYNEDWKLLHMMPEETVRASVDLKSKLILPIHCGAFTLAFHDWIDPIERVMIKANELNMHVTTPKIGEPVILENENFPSEKWWLNYIRNNNN